MNEAGIVDGILAALGRNPGSSDLILSLRRVKNLDQNGYRELAKHMIDKGFGGNAKTFIKEISRSCKELVPGNSELMSLPQKLLGGVESLYKDFEKTEYKSIDVLDSLLIARQMFGNDIRGRIHHYMRLCAKALDQQKVAKYAAKQEEEVKNVLAEGLIAKHGPWKVWCMVKETLVS